jgi:hypothetical protein
MTAAAPEPARGERPSVRLDDQYIETAFARRLHATLEDARRDRSWHVVGALSGAGKSTVVAEYLAAHPAVRAHDGSTSIPVLVATPPGFGTSRSGSGLARSLLDNFGTVPPGTQDARRSWLARQIVSCGVEMIVADDAHGADADDLLLLKKLTDEALRAGGRRVGLVLLCAATESATPLRELVERPTLQWSQFRRRMSPTAPWLYVASLGEDEVREVLLAYELSVLRPALPQLRLARWSRRIHRHLVHPYFDHEGSGRVTMQNVRNLVDGVVHRLVESGLNDLGDAAIIDTAAEAMRGAGRTRVIDGDPGTARVEHSS